MGDNSYTAGDPWGLPIEESDDFDVESHPSDEALSDAPDEEPIEREWEDSYSPEQPDWEESRAEPDLDHDVIDTGAPHPDVEASFAAEEPEAEPSEPSDDEEEEEAGTDQPENGYSFKGPTRTPLSQMIAAAQSVVSSVQGGDDTAGEAGDIAAEEPIEPAFDAAGDLPAEPPEEEISPSIEEPADTRREVPADDEDLPGEPPAWLIVDAAESEPATTSPISGDAEARDEDRAFTPEDIEESIAELAAAPQADMQFSEDHFELPTEDSTPEDSLDDLDLESTPGVYQELTDLAGQDAQAESLLQEAAAAFGREDEAALLDDDEPADLEGPEEIDSFAAAFTGEFDATADQDSEDADAEVVDEPLVGVDEIDSFAEALAGGLGTDDSTVEFAKSPDRPFDEPAAEETQEEIESLAEELAGTLETEESIPQEADVSLDADTLGDWIEEADEQIDEAETEDWIEETDEQVDEAETQDWIEETDEQIDEAETEDWVDEVELGEALAGLTDEGVETAPDEDTFDAEQDVVTLPSWDRETAVPAAEVVEEEAVDEPIDLVAEPPAEPDDVADELEDAEPAAAFEPDTAGAALIESPVTWGARYRDAQQGWVDDDEGRSTWRPIVTSGESVAGWELDTYLGLVSGDVSFDPAGTESAPAGIATARDDAIRLMLDDALSRGAHAVVNVTFSIQEIAGAVHVAASGVAVTLRTPA